MCVCVLISGDGWVLYVVIMSCVGGSGLLPAWGVGPGLWLVGF
jgi:hypothetical protein